jgi:hypothetical protein
MGNCFSCKNRIGVLKQECSKKMIMRSGYIPPENITDSDKVCVPCFENIKKTQTKGITHNEKVSLVFQSVILLLGIVIPFVWLYPFYKIGKIGYGLVITIVLTISAFVPLLISFELDLDTTVGGLFIILYFAKIPILFFFLIKWTREWNKDAI